MIARRGISAYRRNGLSPARRSSRSRGENKMSNASRYPVGEPGQPWGEAEVDQWRSQQSRRRLYAEDVVPRIEALADRYEKLKYGQLNYAGELYPLLALSDRHFNPD